ncbi:MAG: class I SAM-dependent methyltransferase [Marinilabiliales bacterium]|nr:MAG: class I SAM-dependent methyltransferase [Marinilabiliales bacterium]
MKSQEKFINHYENGFMPWVHKNPDFNLVEMVDNWPIKACKALEIGCGTGVDSIWLKQKGFDIKAIDVSPIAIKLANENAENVEHKPNFEVFDFLTDDLPRSEYDFVFDRGVFHGNDNLTDRKIMAEKVSNTLTDDGLWLSLIGNSDGEKTDPGPPLRSATEVVTAIEPFFKILAIRASHFGNDMENPSRIWVCLMRKR